MLSLLQDFSNPNIQVDYDNNSNKNELETTNTVTQTAVQSEILKVLQQLQKQLQNLTDEVKTGKKKRDFEKTPDNPPYTRTITDQYC